MTILVAAPGLKTTPWVELTSSPVPCVSVRLRVTVSATVSLIKLVPTPLKILTSPPPKAEPLTPRVTLLFTPVATSPLPSWACTVTATRVPAVTSAGSKMTILVASPGTELKTTSSVELTSSPVFPVSVRLSMTVSATESLMVAVPIPLTILTSPPPVAEPLTSRVTPLFISTATLPLSS